MKRKQIFKSMGISILLGSMMACSTPHVATNKAIQKRKYLKGWHVSSNKQIPSSPTITAKNNVSQQTQPVEEPSSEILPTMILPKQEEDYSKAKSKLKNKLVLIQNKNKPVKKRIRSMQSDTACDIIMLKNGEGIEGKVTEIGLSEIKYKKCDNLDGPAYTLSKYDVFKIKYANGTSALISEIKTTNNSPLNLSSDNGDNSKKLKMLGGWGIILAIISIFTPSFFALIFSIPAIIIGIVVLLQLQKKPKKERSAKTKNVSIWAIIIGVLSLILTLIADFLLDLLFF